MRRDPVKFFLTGDRRLVNEFLGKTTMLNPKDDPWATLKLVAGKATKDFMVERDQGIIEDRK